MSKNPADIIESLYEKALAQIKKDNGNSFLASLKKKASSYLNTIAKHSENSQAVATVLLSSLIYKVIDPSQDVRLHQAQLPKGYSGRGFDTKYVTPFLKKHNFPQAMKESGWLTRSLEQVHPYDLKYSGSIRNKEVKEAFLQTLHLIEEENYDAAKLATALFILFLRVKAQHQVYLTHVVTPVKTTIAEIIEALKEHFFFTHYQVQGASKLPVLAIYAVYEILVRESSRYKSKRLAPLESNTSPDLRSGAIGDITVLNADGFAFEAVEIKHGIKIKADMIRDIEKKIRTSRVRRYYILSSVGIDERETDEIKNLVEQIRTERGCEVVVNGIVDSLKYYLRLIENLSEFVGIYTSIVNADKELKLPHKEAWMQISRKYFRNN